MNKKMQDKIARHIRLDAKGRPQPRYVRCYDGGADLRDRFTITFPRVRLGSPGRYSYPYLGMSSNPFHPQGFGQHGESHDGIIDRPGYSHLGKPIAFADLPEDCQALVLDDYAEYHSLPPGFLNTVRGAQTT